VLRRPAPQYLGWAAESIYTYGHVDDFGPEFVVGLGVTAVDFVFLLTSDGLYARDR